METTFAMMIEAIGGKTRTPQADGSKAIDTGGRIIHEVGGAIMGANAKKSVANQWNQCWEVPNLLLNDGSAFCSNADKNPTLTIMALAWRATDHLIEEMRKGNL
jgi:choline dehydrogenase-like flavoprotein